MPDLTLNKFERTRAYTIAGLFKTYNNLSVNIDLVPCSNALEQKDDYKILKIKDAVDYELSDIINPLIITERGDLLPFCFGIDESYKISNITNQVDQDIKSWKEMSWKMVQQFVQNSFDSFDTEKADYIDWFLHLLNCSEKYIQSKVEV